MLLACGALAAIAVCMLHLSFRVPGHAILRAVIPMAAGIALAPATLDRPRDGRRRNPRNRRTPPRQLSVRLQSAAFVSLVALGPMLDLALADIARRLEDSTPVSPPPALRPTCWRSPLALHSHFLLRRGSGGSGTGGGRRRNGCEALSGNWAADTTFFRSGHSPSVVRHLWCYRRSAQRQPFGSGSVRAQP